MKKQTALATGSTLAIIGTSIPGTDRVLFLGNAALCKLEEEFDMPYRHILEQVTDGVDQRTIAACLKHGFARHHPAPEHRTETAIAEFIDEVGIVTIASAIVKEMNLQMGGAAARAKAA